MKVKNVLYVLVIFLFMVSLNACSSTYDGKWVSEEHPGVYVELHPDKTCIVTGLGGTYSVNHGEVSLMLPNMAFKAKIDGNILMLDYFGEKVKLVKR